MFSFSPAGFCLNGLIGFMNAFYGINGLIVRERKLFVRAFVLNVLEVFNYQQQRITHQREH